MRRILETETVLSEASSGGENTSKSGHWSMRTWSTGRDGTAAVMAIRNKCLKMVGNGDLEFQLQNLREQ